MTKKYSWKETTKFAKDYKKALKNAEDELIEKRLDTLHKQGRISNSELKEGKSLLRGKNDKS